MNTDISPYHIGRLQALLYMIEKEPSVKAMATEAREALREAVPWSVALDL